MSSELCVCVFQSHGCVTYVHLFSEVSVSDSCVCFRALTGDWLVCLLHPDDPVLWISGLSFGQSHLDYFHISCLVNATISPSVTSIEKKRQKMSVKRRRTGKHLSSVCLFLFPELAHLKIHCC